jgi:hypothetical protein
MDEDTRRQIEEARATIERVEAAEQGEFAEWSARHREELDNLAADRLIRRDLLSAPIRRDFIGLQHAAPAYQTATMDAATSAAWNGWLRRAFDAERAAVLDIVTGEVAAEIFAIMRSELAELRAEIATLRKQLRERADEA